MRAIINDFVYKKKGIYGVLHIIILLLSLFLIISISIDTFNNLSFLTQGSYLKIQLWVCIFFIFDFLLEFFMATKKWHYLRTHFIFLIISIPYINIFDYYQVNFSPEVRYLIRFIPLFRGGYAMAIVVGWLSYNKISSLFTSYITLLFTTVYFSSLIFFVIEHKVNPSVPDYQSALWWASMDVTTVGSNIYAVTITGKVLSVLLAALGMMMFPIFTVYVINMVQRTNKQSKAYQEHEAQMATQGDVLPELDGR
jgi:uncharacterized protein (DUF2062 family)